MRQSYFSKLLLGVALFGAALPPAHGAAGPRQRLRFDAGWRFHRGDIPDPSGADGVPVTGWRWHGSAQSGADAAQFAAADADTAGAEWKNAPIADDVFGGREGFAWYRATLPDFKTADPKKTPTLHFESVDDNATIYLNGQKLLEHSGWNDPFDVPLSAAWKVGGPNVVAVLVENTAGAGGIAKPVTLTLASTATPQPARPAYRDGDWRAVQLPHDYVVEGKFTPTADGSHGFLAPDTAWYRKTFRIPAGHRGKSLWLDFDGVFSDAKVWLNGQYLGENRSGYIGCRFDIGSAVNYGGVNTLAVHCDARKFEGWWYEGGGIYRHVWLNVADPLHVAPWGTFVSSAVTGETGQMPAAALTIQTTLTNQAATAEPCVLVSRVQAPDGRLVATLTSRQMVPPGQTLDVRQQANVPGAQLWSIETPQLYRLTTEVQRGGRVTDNYATPFGIRTIRFDAEKGFFLNGKPVKIKGTCNHQDYAGVGVAMPDSLLRWRIQKLKEMGSNGYRTSHNPVAPELLDACDQQGMLVMDETRHLGDTYSGKSPANTSATTLGDLSTMVLRDRNHPSIIMWSMCNEEGIQGSADGARIATAMKRRINEIDGTRPVTAAMNGDWGRGISNVEDLQGGNYNPGGYDGFHRDRPQQPFYGSETASAVTTRGIYTMQRFENRYYGDPQRGYVAAYDLNAPPWAQTSETAWRAIAERPFVAGGFVWTGFDYKGEPTPFGWPCINSHFGIMDECGFPKDNYYYYRAWWGDKPVVHLLPHWNWPGKEGQEIAVWCQGNCDRVELLLNGKSLGTKDMPRYGHLEWQVAYAPGTLEARGYNGDKVAATDRVTTTGAAVAVQLEPSQRQTPLQADNEDVAMIPVSITDAAGRVVPTADNEVSFEVTGPGHIAGVGNGDPASHEPDKANQRHAFNGLCMVIVQTTGQPGRITVTAHAPGLKPATVTLHSAKAAVEDMK